MQYALRHTPDAPLVSMVEADPTAAHHDQVVLPVFGFPQNGLHRVGFHELRLTLRRAGYRQVRVPAQL